MFRMPSAFKRFRQLSARVPDAARLELDQWVVELYSSPRRFMGGRLTGEVVLSAMLLHYLSLDPGTRLRLVEAQFPRLQRLLLPDAPGPPAPSESSPAVAQPVPEGPEPTYDQIKASAPAGARKRKGAG